MSAARSRQYSASASVAFFLLQLGPEPVALLHGGRERLLGTAGALLGIRDRLGHSSSAIRGASRLKTQKPSTKTPTHDRARHQQISRRPLRPRVGARSSITAWRNCWRIVASGLNQMTRWCSFSLGICSIA